MSRYTLAYLLLIIGNLIWVNLTYAADIQEDQVAAFTKQEQLVQKIMDDLERHQARLKAVEQDGRDLSAKNRTELEYYKELTESLTQDIQASEKDIQNLEKSMAEFRSKHRTYEKEKKNLVGTVNTLTTGVEEIRFKTSVLDKQKGLIEDNSIRLYEILVDVRARYEYLFAELNTIKGQQTDFAQLLLEQDQEQADSVSVSPLMLKNLFFISFIFFMPLAFALRYQDSASRDIVLIVTTSAILGYAILGFGIKYGDSSSGLFSFSNPLLLSLVNIDVVIPDADLITDFLHKMSFILLPVLIIACIVNQQFSGIAHIITALLASAVLIPVFGHWVWSDSGWLAGQGFTDGMGSIVLNMIPAWLACMMLYRRRSVWIKPKQIQLSAYSTASALLLLLGWFGLALNAFEQSEAIFNILLNILLAASTGGLCGFAYHAFFVADPVSRAHRLTGGFVTGLAAIAACAHVVTFAEACSIGAIAGVVHNVAINVLQKTVLQPTWQAPVAQLVAIHATGGLWGALAVGLFGSAGGFGEPDMDQMMAQLQGIGAAVVYSTLLGLLLGKLPFFSGRTTHSE